MSSGMRHMDCRNFAALDVTKGICHRTKELVPADAECCEHFNAVPKCGCCAHFVAGEPYLGSCNAAPGAPMTYPDLIAVTCDEFEAHAAGRA